MREVNALIAKEVRLEWRQRHALNGMLLYLVSTIFVCYLSFRLKVNKLEPITWNTLFWIIQLFTAVSAIAKSFTQERAGRLLYYYTLASPVGVILSKMIYNTALMLGLSLVGFGVYAFVMGNPVGDLGMYLVSIVLGAMGFAGTLTMVAGIASKAENSPTLMSVLSFPIILPMLLMLLKLSKNALDGLDWNSSSDEILTLLALNGIVWILSLILFPFIWKS
ncbi:MULTISPECIES: heme exporter protein CcmB [unclassified Siphonobacter]|uniref:heme exporter protein CcmB n=1 Tax=unclassified Siphonobacter TaxID=2635712 RepID=UPI000CBAF43D|nr:MULTISPECIES: heme exporter protein CcmB [unclassified Siphonobacter]MDQ1088389.1 heme exporter protein B [Siphonobacter sp. SORGH_AS_1065]MDR6194530.1 heme exporter protein B [Siphonobacter sp. SORGH_AS_0500]PKK37812.1 ABC transporter permease [Siphonobacter sp. SORGH_AS_0500]